MPAPSSYTYVMSRGITTITYDPDTQTYTHAGGGWSDTYPVADLPRWLDFYRRQRRDFPRASTSYDADIEALEALARDLGIYIVDDAGPATPPNS